MSIVKYPRTPHLPFSPGYAQDDEQLIDISDLQNAHIVVTEKMDGECTSLYKDTWHARSLSPRKHESRDWMANYWSTIKQDIPHNHRICGENLYAQHSIHYPELPSYFLAFNVWDAHNTALSWSETRALFNKLNLSHVPVLYEGKFSWDALTAIASQLDTEKSEGFVVRVRDEIPYHQFNRGVAKWVRKNHVASDTKNWFNSKVQKNGIRPKETTGDA